MAEQDVFCLLLWVSQGGSAANGQPIFSANRTASGYCGNPECYRCPLMQNEIAQHPAGHANWVCPACLRDVVQLGKDRGIQVHLTGHYTEGQCQFVGCTRPPRFEYRDAEPFVEGDADSSWIEMDIVERPRGYSRFLQLVIGNINT